MDILSKKIFSECTDILDEDCLYETWGNFSESIALSRRSLLVKSIHDFILERDANKHNYICVSLSGGVDSMVLAYILHVLKLVHSDFTYNIVCFHIDYNNRKESHMEAEFLELFCKHFGIIFHKVVIEEFTRGVTARDVYEEKTRELRYDHYKELVKKYNLSGILVGHHLGDMTENVFTNIMKGRTISDLCVMHPQSTVNGVILWRPMLEHEKDDIFDYAKMHAIPWFKDTTPEWSNRGIMRRDIFPMLEKQYGPNFKKNLYKLGLETLEQGDIYESEVLDKIYAERVKIGIYGIYIDFRGYEQYETFFWSTLLMKVLHSVNLPMISNGSLSLVVKQRKASDSCVNIGKSLLCYINSGHMIIPYNSFSPETFAKETLESFIGMEIIRGHWKINISKEDYIEGDEVYNQVSGKDVIKGKFSYKFPFDYNDDRCSLIINGKAKTQFRKMFECMSIKLMKIIPLIVPNKFENVMTGIRVNITCGNNSG